MSTEIERKTINSGDGQQFDVKDLPAIISGQVDKLNELDLSVKNAIRSANKAESAAKYAHGKSAGFGKKKEAIEELQDAGLELATAVQSSAEAQKISLEFQRKLADITKFLFQLGTSNIASNRFVVSELELRLKGASSEQISDLARQEIQSVLRQLKEQEDILKRQQEINEKLKEHNNTITEHKNALDRANQELKEKEKIDARQESILKELAQDLQDKSAIDKKQEESISEIQKQLKQKNSADSDREKSISDLQEFVIRQASVDTIQTETIEKIKEFNELMKEKVELIENKWNHKSPEQKTNSSNLIFSVISVAISLIAIVIAILK